MKSFTTAVAEVETTDAEEEFFVPFDLDGREYHSFRPLPGQLVFMLASVGRGQTDDNRLAGMMNIMLSTFRAEDRDVFEGRMISRGKDRLEMETIEAIFEYLMVEWFATPTQQPSDSAESQQTDGQN